MEISREEVSDEPIEKDSKVSSGEEDNSESDFDGIDASKNSSQITKSKSSRHKFVKIENEEKPVLSEFEKIRLQNIAERNELLR